MAQTERATPEQLEKMFKYIKAAWRVLSRSNDVLAKSAYDPKFRNPTGTTIVYLSQKENRGQVLKSLREQMNPADFDYIEFRDLPAAHDELTEHGLLYLPHPYVIPGGRFNEMYGWDSYFILLGLLRDGETELAKNMTDNFLYQVEHYGKVLNANRSYYLSRSQPPFLSRMVLEVYQGQPDKDWLRRAAPLIEKYYEFWTKGDHLTPETKLSRYYDLSDKPAPEVIADERDSLGRTHYDRVRQFYHDNKITDYDVDQYYDRAKDELTPLFYRGDRSMRESGFDPSNRFGHFSVDIINYNPVCLNSLLYLIEKDMAEISREIGDQAAAKNLETKAEQRKTIINKLFWDERDGLYYDYNFKTEKLRRYPFVTTFYPLWMRIASREQARRVVENLKLFERAGGLQTSTNRSGSQWDAPFGWSPMQLIAIEGLRRYGYDREADRLTINYLSVILKEFIQHQTILEKYDVVRRESEVSQDIDYGYDINVIGFGWTNAAVVRLYDRLPEKEREKVLQLNGVH
jgi:alpha,alpha-trehalase